MGNFKDWSKIRILTDDDEKKEIATLTDDEEVDEAIKVAKGYVVAITPKI